MSPPSLTAARCLPLDGSPASPTELNNPDGKMRWRPLAGSTSQIAARPSSLPIPFSPTLLLEPTDTYSFDPSGRAMTFLVQWWLILPPGRPVILVPGLVMCVAPLVYGKRISASVLAT